MQESLAKSLVLVVDVEQMWAWLTWWSLSISLHNSELTIVLVVSRKLLEYVAAYFETIFNRLARIE